MRKFIIPSIIILLTLSSCEFMSSLIHDDQLVARIGKYKLYQSEVSRYLPANISAEDSVNLTMKYINSWATEILYAKVADSHLSKQEKDIASEIEEYTRSLIKFRYEQHYVNDRLDTLITEPQIKEYYQDHKRMFTLQRPVLKYRFAILSESSMDAGRIEKLLGATDRDDVYLLDSLARKSAIKYSDCSSEWVDASVFAKEFGMDYPDVISKMESKRIEMKTSNTNELMVAYVFDMVSAGREAPLEFCEDRIRDMILNTRKHELLSTLEQDLLQDALDHKQLVIY